MFDVITFLIILGWLMLTIKSIADEGVVFTLLSQGITIPFIYALLGGH